MCELQIFNHEEYGQIRTVKVDGKQGLVAADVAKALGYKDTTSAIKRHCKGVVKRHILTNGGNQAVNIIFKPDLYRLASHSELPGAAEFESWIFDEVLVSIDEHGAYMTDKTIEQIADNPDLLIELATKLENERQKHKQTRAALEDKTIQLDENKSWYSVKRVAKINGVNWREISWRKLKNTSEYMRYETKKIFDANYGNVNAYHIDVWRQEYPGFTY